MESFCKGKDVSCREVSGSIVPVSKYRIVVAYTGFHRRKGPNFGRVFLMLNYTDITQNTYIQS